MIPVTVLYRYLSIEDACPKCGRGIRVAVAQSGQGARLYRLECPVCNWTTEALPDPEAN